MKTLYLIDGHAQFFRAFHAIRTPMSSPVTKEPTNATFGFVGMMLKLFRQYKPDYVAVAIDVSGDRETFRSELYPDYKATRTAPPESFGPQVQRCIALLKEVGVPVIAAPGFEADDVIATISRRAAAQGLKVRIVSKDKDLKQLLDQDKIELFDVHNDTLIDPAFLMAEQGITPAQVIDVLTLMGDSVDNVPGVDGVGPKTAAELIKQYGTLDNLIAHADEVKGKRGEKLREAIPRLGLSKQLITLRHDTPVELAMDAAAYSGFKLEKLIALCKELGFGRYQDEVRQLIGGAPAETGAPGGWVANTQREETALPSGSPLAPGAEFMAEAARKTREKKAAPGPDALFSGGLFSEATDGDGQGCPTPRKAESGQYRTVRTTDELAGLVRELEAAPIFAFDTETTGLSPLTCRLCGLSFSTRVGEGWYVPVCSPAQEQHLDEKTVLAALKPILEDPKKPKCGHNLKFDALVLRAAGVEVGGIGTSAFDSMVASYLIDASRSSHGMDSLALALLRRTNISITELLGTGKNQKTFDSVDLALATEYAGEDADVTLQLQEVMSPQLNAMGLRKLFEEVEMPLVGVLADLEWNGIIVDPGELSRQEARLTERIRGLRDEIAAAAPEGSRGFSPDSPKQLAAVLFNKPGDDPPGLGLKPGKKLKTGYSTDIEVLEKLAADPEIGSKLPQLIVDYRQLTKLVGTYLIALRGAINPGTKRIHAGFHQTVAATGRLASSDPNLQNIPIRSDVGREIRKAFVAPEGCVLISADYSQIELRLLAHLSRDPALKEAFEKGEDIHTAVAAQIHGVPLDQVTKEQRNGAKMVNFGIVYGVTPFGLARRLGVPTEQAAAIIDGYKRRFAGITTFLQECIDQAQRHGDVGTVLGRGREIVGIESRHPAERALAERTAINSVVQGSAADLIKVAMVNIARSTGRRGGKPGAKYPDLVMLLQIHDELVFECPEEKASEAAEYIKREMESAMALDVPLKVEVGWGRSWLEGK